jgi:hypothetical protein
MYLPPEPKAVIVYEPDPKHCPVAVAVTVGIGSVAMVIGNIKVQLLASMICANQLYLLLGLN